MQAIIQQLVAKFGPVLGQLLAQWIQKQLTANPTAFLTHSTTHFGAPLQDAVKLTLPTGAIQAFIVSLLQNHKSEFVAWVDQEVSTLYDQAVAALGSGTAS